MKKKSKVIIVILLIVGVVLGIGLGARYVVEYIDAKNMSDVPIAHVDFIACPSPTDTKVTLPEIDGCTITIEESSHPDIVDTDGIITRSDDTTYGVDLTLRVTDDESGRYSLTEPLLVPIYKTFVKPTISDEEVAKAHEDYNSKAYGLFVHYVGQSVYADGTGSDGNEIGINIDKLANQFDAKQFAKDADEFGVEYVMFTCWHADMRTLFPSMTNERWRDSRRVLNSYDDKSYSDRDVISDLLDALEPYGIDLYLYTHPSDGHDFTLGDQMLTGWNDNANEYATWNDYINELYYEMCERYGDRIKCLWFDGVYNHVYYNMQERLRETCLTFNPAMILTMNTGFEEGNLDPQPNHICPDYRCWEVNRYVDYENDMKISRYQSAIVMGKKGWWTTVAQSSSFKIQPADEMFRYIVAMSSVSTHGGFAASTGFYPARKRDDLQGNYWMAGIRDTLVEVNDYLEPVAESVKNTSIGKAFPTKENVTVSELEWGVSTESRDGKYIYLHVLHAPAGRTLRLPDTSDGSILSTEAEILNFDNTTTRISINKVSGGYAITLPENVQWNQTDTVIKVQRTSGVSN